MADLRTLTRMLGFMLLTFPGTGGTDLCAEVSNRTGEIGAPRHKGGGDPADFRAVAARSGTVRPVFGDTRIGTKLTLQRASHANVHASFIFFARHFNVSFHPRRTRQEAQTSAFHSRKPCAQPRFLGIGEAPIRASDVQLNCEVRNELPSSDNAHPRFLADKVG